MNFISFHTRRIATALLCIPLFVCFACRKAKTVRTPAELLPQVWYVNYFTKVNYANNGNINSIDTLLMGNGSDYVDFNNKPWAYIHFNSVQDTVPYVLLNATTLLFDQDTMTIDGISETAFQYSKSNRSLQPYYDEIYRFYR